MGRSSSRVPEPHGEHRNEIRLPRSDIMRDLDNLLKVGASSLQVALAQALLDAMPVEGE